MNITKEKFEELNRNSMRYVYLRDFHIGNSPEAINLDAKPGQGLDDAIDQKFIDDGIDPTGNNWHN